MTEQWIQLWNRWTFVGIKPEIHVMEFLFLKVEGIRHTGGAPSVIILSHTAPWGWSSQEISFIAGIYPIFNTEELDQTFLYHIQNALHFYSELLNTNSIQCTACDINMRTTELHNYADIMQIIPNLCRFYADYWYDMQMHPIIHKMFTERVHKCHLLIF